MAITSSHRISKKQALYFLESYAVFHSNGMVIRTYSKFLPKVVSDFDGKQTITLPLFFQTPSSLVERSLYSLDGRRGLKNYLDKTKDSEKSKRWVLIIIITYSFGHFSVVSLDRLLLAFCSATLKQIQLCQ